MNTNVPIAENNTEQDPEKNLTQTDNIKIKPMTENGSKPQHFDVVISGGGLSGLLTAIGLRQESPELNIAIVDPYASSAASATSGAGANSPSRQNESHSAFTNNFDGRCIALSYGSLKLLQHWQVWPNLKPHAWPIKTIITSDKGHIGKTILKATDFKLTAMGLSLIHI